MENSADKNPIWFRAIKDDMPPLLKTAKPGMDWIAGFSHLRQLCDLLKAFEKVCEICISLILAPSVSGVIQDFSQICFGQP